MNIWSAILASVLILGTAEAAEPILVFGHRGMMQTAPENTLAGFQACLDSGSGFELDIRRSRDGKLIILHDETVDRTTDGTGKVREKTLAELKLLDAGSKWNKSFREERIPTVTEVFALLKKHPKPQLAVAVDLKINDGMVEADLVKEAKSAEVLDRLLFIGLTIENGEVRSRLRKADASCNVARLVLKSEDLPETLEDKSCNWVYLRFIPTREQVKTIHAHQKRIFQAGVLFAKKEIENWTMAAEVGVDAILTDFPKELLELQRK